MKSRSPLSAFSASPVMVGAVTVLVAVVTVTLAYNANKGLPFVPSYRVSVEIPNAARVGANNEVRIGGVRVGVVEALDPVVAEGAPAQTDPAEADELPPVAARLTLKLDKSAAPLPQDSIFRVRYRSTFGLKYLEVVRGEGPPAPEGHVFVGTDDGAVCDLPADGGRFASTVPAASRNGCFQGQTEFDEINDTFDRPTRQAQRDNFVGYGSALAARGVSLNQTIAELPRLFRGLGPVARTLADPEVDFGRFIRGIYRTARYTSPAAREQAESFALAAIAFRAISSDPEKLKETISEAAPTYETGIELLPGQQAFLARVEKFARLMRPGARDLRATLPVLNDAIETGTPVLRKAPPVNRDLEAVLEELDQLLSQPSTGVTLERLGEAFRIARPLVRWVAPAQTVCNLFNYWFTYLPSALGDRSQVGYGLRQALVRYPGFPTAQVGLGSYAGVGPNGLAAPSGEFQPYEIPITNTHPFAPTGQDGDDCQPGQTGYPLGRNPVPGQRASDPANRVSDLPGSRGPTIAFWNADRKRVLFDSRVPSRQPDSWKDIGE